jgi:hypothetical protein
LREPRRVGVNALPAAGGNGLPEEELVRGYRVRFEEPFPVHRLKHVDHPTTRILGDQVQRVDERENGFTKAARGDDGPVLKAERNRAGGKQKRGELAVSIPRYNIEPKGR